MRSEARKDSGALVISIGIGIFATPYLLLDLAVGFGVDAGIDHFRDPTGEIAIDAHKAAEELANRICYGSDKHHGLYGAFLELARRQNDRLRETLNRSPAAPTPDKASVILRGEK